MLVVGSVVSVDWFSPKTLSKMDVTGSTGVDASGDGEVRLSKSSTHCTVCATALSAFVTAWDGLLFKSPCTVENADWAVLRLPLLRALPNDARSVESCELLEASVVADVEVAALVPVEL